MFLEIDFHEYINIRNTINLLLYIHIFDIFIDFLFTS